MDNRKLELVTDFYEFTMSNGYSMCFLEKFLMAVVMLYLLA